MKVLTSEGVEVSLVKAFFLEATYTHVLVTSCFFSIGNRKVHLITSPVPISSALPSSELTPRLRDR